MVGSLNNVLGVCVVFEVGSAFGCLYGHNAFFFFNSSSEIWKLNSSYCFCTVCCRVPSGTVLVVVYLSKSKVTETQD